MGCLLSRHARPSLTHVDDSVHVMLSHEKKLAKKKGEPAAAEYVPRAEHPLFSQPQQSKGPIVATEEPDS
jgi:hypothetical protein